MLLIDVDGDDYHMGANVAYYQPKIVIMKNSLPILCGRLFF